MFDISGGLSLNHPGEIIKHLVFIIVLAFVYLAFILLDSYDEEYKMLLVKGIFKSVLYCQLR
jgi:hypothetical protein